MKNNGRIVATLSLAVLCGASALAQQSNQQKSAASTAQFRYIASEEGPGGQGQGPRPDGQGFGAHAGGHFGPPGMWWKNPDLIQKLNLTDDQRKRMDDIFQQSRLQLIDLKANVEKQETILDPMLAANPPDTNKVLTQIDQVASARAELEKSMARMLLSIRGVLSADQWTKLQAERPAFHRKFDGRGGPGFGPGGSSGPGSKGPGAPIN